MPLYEYRCGACGRVEERNRTVTERNDETYYFYCQGECARILTTPHLHGSPNMPND